MARANCFVQTVKVDHLRFEVNPLNAEIKSGDFVLVGNVSGIADMDATATGPLTIQTENGILFHAPLEAQVGDSVFSAADGTLTVAAGSAGSSWLVGQVVERISATACVVQKFAQAIDVV